MFEKEVKTIFRKKANKIAERKVKEFYKECGWEDYKYMISEFSDVGTECYQKGAEFGYNKANEWHFVNWKYFADKDSPKSEMASYLVQLKNKDTLICEWETEEGFGNFWDSNLEPIDNDDVYAWKEIIPPKLEEDLK